MGIKASCKSGVLSCPVNSTESGLLLDCVKDGCRWWIAEEQECSIVILARSALKTR